MFCDYKIRMDIKEFLEQHKLSNYWDKFDETGNDDLEELATLSETELRGILKNDITMKDGHIRKFLNAVAILKSGGKKESTPGTNESQSKSLTMPDKVKLLLIPHPQSKKDEMYNKIVKCLFEQSFPLMEIDNFLEYAKSQRNLRWKLQEKCSDYETFFNYKNSKDGQWINVSKYSQPTEKSFKKKDLYKVEKSRQFLNNHLDKINSFITEFDGRRNSLFRKDHNVPEFKSNELLFYDDLLTRSHKVMDHLNLVNSWIISAVNSLKKFIH